MTFTERINLLMEWEKTYYKIDAYWEKLNDLFDMYPDSPIGEIIWGTFHTYTNLVAKSIGDNAHWLEWYCWENNMGKNEYEAKASNWDVEQKITNIETLCDLIEVDLE